MHNNPLLSKSFSFSQGIIHLAKALRIKAEFEISGQLLDSGTSIGSNIAEANVSQSRKDFLAKMYIALKEGEETKYWLKLIKKSNLVEENIDSYLIDLKEILKMLSSSIRTAKRGLN